MGDGTKKTIPVPNTGVKFEIVDELPTENISPVTIYFVPADPTMPDNNYRHYVRINNKWELLDNDIATIEDDDIDKLFDIIGINEKLEQQIVTYADIELINQRLAALEAN